MAHERLDGIAGQFKLSARTIQAEGAHLAPMLAASDKPDSLLWSACRGMGRARLDELAQRIESGAGWDELILPDAQKGTLRQIVAHVRNRIKVYQGWGFADNGARVLWTLFKEGRERLADNSVNRCARFN